MATALVSPKPISLFISYSHQDADLCLELRKHLALLTASHVIEHWHDGQLSPGLLWAEEIKAKMAGADIILLLISSDFLASEHIRQFEIPLALEQHGTRRSIVIPIVLRPVDWKRSPLYELEALPSKARPITEWQNRDAAFRDVAARLRELIYSKLLASINSERSLPSDLPAVEDRILDAAVALRVPLGTSTDVVCIIRKIRSKGLKTILRIDRRYTATEDEVQSTTFEVNFPKDSSGRYLSTVIELLLQAPDFEPAEQRMRIVLPHNRDPGVRVFMIAPKRLGHLKCNLHVIMAGEMCAGSCMLVTESVPPETAPPETSYEVVSVPFSDTNVRLLFGHEYLRNSPIEIPPPAKRRIPHLSRPALVLASTPLIILGASLGWRLLQPKHAQPEPARTHKKIQHGSKKIESHPPMQFTVTSDATFSTFEVLPSLPKPPPFQASAPVPRAIEPVIPSPPPLKFEPVLPIETEPKQKPQATFPNQAVSILGRLNRAKPAAALTVSPLIEGTWVGTMALNRRLIVKISASADVPSLATFPDEKNDATVKDIVFEEISNTVAFQAFGIDFAGNLTADTIRGTATQNGVGAKFDLRRQRADDVVGDWVGYLKDDTAIMVLHLEKSHGKLTATAESPYLHKIIRVQEITVADKEMNFAVPDSLLFPQTSTPGPLRFSGVIYSDEIRGTLQYKAEEIPLTFKRE